MLEQAAAYITNEEACHNKQAILLFQYSISEDKPVHEFSL
jgi:hypothetical protein